MLIYSTTNDIDTYIELAQILNRKIFIMVDRVSIDIIKKRAKEIEESLGSRDLFFNLLVPILELDSLMIENQEVIVNREILKVFKDRE